MVGNCAKICIALRTVLMTCDHSRRARNDTNDVIGRARYCDDVTLDFGGLGVTVGLGLRVNNVVVVIYVSGVRLW